MTATTNKEANKKIQTNWIDGTLAIERYIREEWFQTPNVYRFHFICSGFFLFCLVFLCHLAMNVEHSHRCCYGCFYPLPLKPFFWPFLLSSPLFSASIPARSTLNVERSMLMYLAFKISVSFSGVMRKIVRNEWHQERKKSNNQPTYTHTKIEFQWYNKFTDLKSTVECSQWNYLV